MTSRIFPRQKLPLVEKAAKSDVGFQSKKPRRLSGLYGYLILTGVVFLIIVVRLFGLTIVRGHYFRNLSDQNRIRELVIEPERGKIIDRKGFIIASNEKAQIDQADERLFSRRIYREAEALAHLVGYRQTADEDDLKNDLCLNKLQLGDKTGKRGAEKLYDCGLRGRAGKKLVEVDASGKSIKTLSVVSLIAGQTLQLAVDFDLQQKAFQLIKDKKAAVVALKPQTGEVLVLVSAPSFSPQEFEESHSSEIENYFKNEGKPLFNRATEGVYPPGSIFKPVVAVGALEEKVIDEKTQFEDTGIITAGPLTFGNWYFLQYGKTEGMLDVVKAIRRSNDIFFYKTGEKLGVDKIKFWAEKFNYGRRTNLGFDEAEGLIPSSFWKKKVLKDNWYLGDTYNLSIGQGYLQVTPLQVAVATATIANNGYLCQPKLLKNNQPNCQKLPISQNTLDLVKEGMRQACSPGGTGWPLFEFRIKNLELRINKENAVQATSSASFRPIQTACKTGTAETYTKSSSPHAWFTVYAPYEKPEIVLTVLIEEGGQGSDVAGPVAKEILRAYFERNE